MGKKEKKGDAPAHLSADARQMWRDIIAEYDGWGHLTRRLFGSMLRMIAALPLPDG